MNEPWKDKATGKIYYPVNVWICPYWRAGEVCSLEHVEENCDDFYAFWEDDVEEWFSNKCGKESVEL